MYKCPNCGFQGDLDRFTPHDPISNNEGRWCPHCHIALCLLDNRLDIYTDLQSISIARWFTSEESFPEEAITTIRRKHAI